MNNKDNQYPQEETAAPDEVRLFPSLDRFNAFSDGVLAIAITLLVLELPVPPSDVAAVCCLGSPRIASIMIIPKER